MWPSRRLPSSILVTVLIQAVNSEAEKHAAEGDKKVAAPAVGDKKNAEGDKQVAVVVKKIGEVPLLNYHDIFLPGKGGKPTLGSTKATCWARGGICIDIRFCTPMQFDPSVAGCTQGFKVCCKTYKFGTSALIGVHRKSSSVQVFSSNLQELNQDSVKQMALGNANILKNIK